MSSSSAQPGVVARLFLYVGTKFKGHALHWPKGWSNIFCIIIDSVFGKRVLTYWENMGTPNNMALSLFSLYIMFNVAFKNILSILV